LPSSRQAWSKGNHRFPTSLAFSRILLSQRIDKRAVECEDQRERYTQDAQLQEKGQRRVRIFKHDEDNIYDC